MIDGHPQSRYSTAWQAIEAMLDDGEPFANLEDVIDRAPLDEDERAALWLAGWARSSRRREHRLAASNAW